MKSPDHPLDQHFRGFLALLRARRHRLWAIPVVTGLVPGIALGALLSTDAGFNSYLRGTAGSQFILIPFALALFVPLVGSVTFSSRRMELLSLPLGRLALPLANLCRSLLLLGIWLAMFLGALLAVLGTHRLQQAYQVGVECSGFGESRFEFQVCLFLAVWAIATIGHASSAICMVIWPVVPAVLCVALAGSSAEQSLYGSWWLLSLDAYYLSLPFFLYAQAPSCWAPILGSQRREGAHGMAFFTSCVALVVLALGDWCWPLGVVVAVGAALTWLRGRRAPRAAHGAEPILWRVHLLALATALPLVVFGLVVDARRVAEVRPGGDIGTTGHAPSPDNRYLAVGIMRAQDESNFWRAAPVGAFRVVVLDLQGVQPPVILSPRYADIQGWSQDGRYLAVRDLGFGRMLLSNARWETWRSRSRWELAPHTLIYDTRTGSSTRIPIRDVAPGWNSIEELVTIRTNQQEWYLEDGRGRRASLALIGEQGGWAQIQAYEDGAARFEVPAVKFDHLRRRWDDQHGVFFGGECWRWGAAGLERDLQAEHESWLVTTSHREIKVSYSQDPFRVDLRIERSDARVELERVKDRWFLAAPDPMVAYVDPEGLWRAELLTGERKLLVPGARRAWGGELSIAYRRAEAFVVDIRAGTARALPWSGAGRSYLSALSDGRLLVGSPDGELWLQESDGATRQLMGSHHE